MGTANKADVESSTEKALRMFSEAVVKVGVPTPQRLEVRGVPFVFLSWPEHASKELRAALELLTLMIGGMTGCRAVSIDRLRYITTFGCDVDPTTAPLYVDHVDKALEYGDWPEVIEIFHAGKLERTYAEVPSDTAPDKLAELTRTFPTQVPSADGKWLWLSRLSPDDKRLAKPYETDYARWIPGDPWEVLVACMVLVTDRAGWDRIAEMFTPRIGAPEAELP